LTVRGENNVIQTFETTDNHAFWVVTDKPDLERMAREMITVENVGNEDIELLIMCKRKRRACVQAQRAQWLSKVVLIFYTIFFSKMVV
jgi:hypothetical protein